MAKKSKSILPVATSPETYRPSKEDAARERRYRAEEDLRTMQRVAEIKKDPARSTAMKELAKEQLAAARKC